MGLKLREDKSSTPTRVIDILVPKNSPGFLATDKSPSSDTNLRQRLNLNFALTVESFIPRVQFKKFITSKADRRIERSYYA